MTRPRRTRITGGRRSVAKRPIKTVRSAEFPNLTTVHGSVIHTLSETADPDANEPACGWQMRSRVYTSEPVNCTACRGLGE